MIFGDGETSRDFTYVANALHANDLALFTEDSSALNEVYNVACGDQISLNEMVAYLKEITGKDIDAVYKSERPGDVKHSKADISKISQKLGYRPQITFREGLKNVFEWYEQQNKLIQ